MFDDIGFRETGHKVSYRFGMGWVMASTPCQKPGDSQRAASDSGGGGFAPALGVEKQENMPTISS